MKNRSIAIVLTVFNRVEKTKRCVESILAANTEGKYQLSFFITNDGSTDGTREYLSECQKSKNARFIILEGDGGLFWNKGMHKAFGKALQSEFDYYLWVNNDVLFERNFLDILIDDAEAISRHKELFLICGSVRYFESNDISYGGARLLSKVNPYKHEIVQPNGKPQECECINGNCVLIPLSTAKAVGNVDERYEHACGDFDYGYSLIAAGGQPYNSSFIVGQCDRNSISGTWRDPALSIRERIVKKESPNGMPTKSWNVYLKKWFPKLRSYYLIRPYFVIVITSTKYRFNKLVHQSGSRKDLNK